MSWACPCPWGVWDWITATSTQEKPLDAGAQGSAGGGNASHRASSARPKASRETPGVPCKSTGGSWTSSTLKQQKEKSCGTSFPAPAHHQGHREGFGHREFKPTAADVALHPAAHICPFPNVCPFTFLGEGEEISIHAIGSKTVTARESAWEKLSGTNLEIIGVMQ